MVKKLLNPSVQVLRVAALAGGAGGLAAFFGLPLASAFFALEIPHMDGAEFALEAYSACVVAGVVGTSERIRYIPRLHELVLHVGNISDL